MEWKLCGLVLLWFTATVFAQVPDGTEKILQEISSASNTFGVELHRQMMLISGGNKNCFFSPLSIYAALAMVNAGARGETSHQLQTVLNWNTFSSPASTLSGHKKIKLFIKTAFRSSEKEPIRFANKVWSQRYFCSSICKGYVKLLKDNYFTTLGITDFAGNPEKARLDINKWVADQTANKIPELLEAGSVRSMTRLVITNAIYFKKNWKYQFDKSATLAAPFYVSKETTVKANMMTMTSVIPYTEDRDNMAIELPYTSDTISMILILPHKRDGIKKLEQSFDNRMLRKYVRSLRKRKVKVSIPKFKIKSDLHLKDYLSIMGVKDLFDPSKADLSGIFGYKGLFVTHAIHQGFVDVNEEGTEAAAVTGISASFRSLIPLYYTFNANHPFIFVIIHKPTNGILFHGEIADPTKELANEHT